MQRVLLVIDDYGELLFLQTLLKKLGFDVDGIQNERSFEESFLVLNPELVIATAKGKRVNGLELAEKLRRRNGLPKMVLLASGTMFDKLREIQIENVDAILESPVATTSLLQSVARICQVDEVALLEKYRKFKATLSPDSEADLQILKRDRAATTESESSADDSFTFKSTGETPTASGSTSVKPSTLSTKDRRERFKKVLSELDKPSVQRFDAERVKKFTKVIRASENQNQSKDLEGERQSFVKAMFKRAKRMR